VRRVLTALAFAVICAGCEEQRAPAASAVGSISGEGAIRRGVGPECADTWSVETADGDLLWPVNDPALQIDGLRVRFTARKNEGAMSLCMAGTNVDFTQIERERAAPEPSGEPARSDAAGFVNKVWQVDRSSSAAPGTLYVFLSEGTLIVTSPNEKPMVGSWSAESGRLTMVEEGLRYEVDVLRLTPDRFEIRSLNPGESVEISLVPAEVRSPLAARAEGAEPPGGDAPDGIWKTAWLLEDLGGAGVIDSAQATLEFPEEGRAAGRATCNRFFASVTVSGGSIRFSAIGSTRMACPEEALANQEAKYLKALEGAERFAIEGTALEIHSRGMTEPLRFTRTSP
jgi:heat shock protein HslJ